MFFGMLITALISFAEPAYLSMPSLTAAPRAKKIVSSRTGKVDCLRPQQSSVSVFETQKEEFVDENRDVKEVLTDIVVKEFFRTPESLYNFLEATYTTINKELDAYRKKHGLSEHEIFFIFKGGNVLKMLANAEILNRVPPSSRAILEAKFGDYFKRSDADFSVLIDPNIAKLDFDVVSEDIVDIVSRSLNTIRDQFNAAPKKYFDFLQFDNSSASSVLADYMKTLNDLKILQDPSKEKWYRSKFLQLQLLDAQADPKSFCPYIGAFDSQQVHVPRPTDKVVSLLVGEKPHWLANSTNLSLEFSRPGDETKLAKFYLLREKVQFQMVRKKNGDSEEKIFGGELIDVSIPHRRDTQLQDTVKHYDKWIKEYAMLSPDAKRSFIFKSESIEGLLEDILEILFSESPRPWNNGKFEKRINRLFFLASVDIFKTIGTGSAEMERYFHMLDDKILRPALALQSLEYEAQINLLENIKKNAEELLKEWPQLQMMNKLWWAIANMLVDRLVNNPKEDDKEKFSSFVKLLKENIDTLRSLKGSLATKIPNAPVYEINVTDLY